MPPYHFARFSPPAARIAVAPVLAALLAAALLAAACQPAPQGQAAKKKAAYELYREYAREFPQVKDISPEALMALKDPVIIDVRSDKERQVSMIKNAVTGEEFLKNPKAFGARPLAAYCTIGYRSAEFAQKMAEKGIVVKNLQAGILGWLHAGGEIAGPGGAPSKTVDVYGEDWDLAPDGIKTVW